MNLKRVMAAVLSAAMVLTSVIACPVATKAAMSDDALETAQKFTGLYQVPCYLYTNHGTGTSETVTIKHPGYDTAVYFQVYTEGSADITMKYGDDSYSRKTELVQDENYKNFKMYGSYLSITAEHNEKPFEASVDISFTKSTEYLVLVYYDEDSKECYLNNPNYMKSILKLSNVKSKKLSSGAVKVTFKDKSDYPDLLGLGEHYYKYNVSYQVQYKINGAVKKKTITDTSVKLPKGATSIKVRPLLKNVYVIDTRGEVGTYKNVHGKWTKAK